MKDASIEMTCVPVCVHIVIENDTIRMGYMWVTVLNTWTKEHEVHEELTFSGIKHSMNFDSDECILMLDDVYADSN